MRHFVEINQEIREAKENGKKTQFVYVWPDYSASAEDLMRKGGKFYAVLDTETGMWSTDESDVTKFIDRDVKNYVRKNFQKDDHGNYIYVKRDGEVLPVREGLLDRSSSNLLKAYSSWFQVLPPNNHYVQLDTELTFKDDKVTPKMYRSKRLPYVIQEGSIESYDSLMSRLYSPEDRQKIEWSIGAVYTGASKKIEKILVLYGKPGSGKSTILDLIKALFDGYYSVFVASELVSKTHQFATSAFKDNPLLAIQDDGDLSKIESPVINEIISHKEVMINEKGKQQYPIKSNAYLILATNSTIDLQDRRMGITRRLLDCYPASEKEMPIPVDEYNDLVERVKFEYGAIAAHCINVFNSLGKNYYTKYVPEKMLERTNPIQNFLYERMEAVTAREYITRSELYSMYKEYCTDSGINYPPKMIDFGEQIRVYFNEYYKFKRYNGLELRHAFGGLKYDMVLGTESNKKTDETKANTWLVFDQTESLLDKLYSDQPAQYAKEDGSPKNKWENVKTKLKDIDTSKLYWIKFPENVIKMDFDLKGKDGEKSLEKNIKAANAFPPTYAELSKSGKGIHLYYIWDGDPNELDDIYAENIEIKKSMGNRAHRRLITKCNSHEITHISSRLPMKGEKEKLFDEKVVITETGLRTTITKCLHKLVHNDTRSNIDFIFKILEDAYSSGLKYDVSDMRQDVLIFAINSTHQSEYCTNKVGEMKFSSEEGGSYDNRYDPNAPIVFFDYEVFPNLVLLCFKYEGESETVQTIFNPKPAQIREFLGLDNKYRNKLIGFNNKDYDNHITYALLIGKSIPEIYAISQGIINNEKGAKFREAYNLSYSDILDFMPEKISLKKWEIRLGITHKECGFKWDMPVPEEHWQSIAEYCQNDVKATEAVFKSKDGQAAWKGRQILCDLANILMGPGSTVNDSTNTLTTKLIIGNDKNANKKFVYPDLSKEFPGYEFCNTGIDKNRYISKDVIITGKSIYKGYDPGEGGFVWANHGMYGRVISFDSASHHPSSIIAENGFGPYTENYKRLLDLRIHIKHKEYDVIRGMYNGALSKYLESSEDAKALSFALKIAINSVYGLTAARFNHPLRDPRNKDNWVAKRGALFMIDLMLNVRAMGYVVIHCKTDSIKILNPDEKVANYISEYGKKFGYTFEIEHIFDRICLVNDAVYVCKYTEDPENEDKAGKWDATGKQFQIPYVFKKLFSGEKIEFKDMCETKNVQSALYLDFNENLPEGEHNYQFVGKTGQFCPIKEGCGGALLMTEKDGKYSSAQSAKGFRWLESEIVRDLHKESDIDTSYYDILVDKARDKLNEFGDYDKFVSDEPYTSNDVYPDFMSIPETDEVELPWD